VKVTRFDPSDTLIIITARIWGSLGDDQVSLAFDTAATVTARVFSVDTVSGLKRLEVVP
jgi:hypothetical protein